METVVNALWDAAPRIGDRVTWSARGDRAPPPRRRAHSRREVQLVDVNLDKAEVASPLGVSFAVLMVATPRADLVIHASGTAAGLVAALDLARGHGGGVELGMAIARSRSRWARASIAAGCALVSSQVGAIATANAPAGTAGAAWRWRSTCSPTLASTRCSPRRRPSRACPRSWRRWRRSRARSCAR